ncbi:MAG: metallophosphoesterase, partial [Terracidiphilus sp.]
CGHTHRQVGWVKNRRGLTLLKPVFEPDCADQFIIQLQKSNRYLFNPGSVGQPRDGDWRASFAIYDDAELSWTWCRAPYDFRAAQRGIRRAGLPRGLATRLRDGS